jgi:hypothetical protein
MNKQGSAPELRRVAQARQASKLAEVREALIAAGYCTIAQQAFALGVAQSTAWALLNDDNKATSAVVINRILSSPNLPSEVRRKFEEYIRRFGDLRLKTKARQASKLAEIREALVSAGCSTNAQQAFALGVNRSTAWAMLNCDKQVGPSSGVLKRTLSSQNLPPAVRGKIKEYINEKIAGRRGHPEKRLRLFRNQFRTPDNEAEGGLHPV